MSRDGKKKNLQVYFWGPFGCKLRKATVKYLGGLFLPSRKLCVLCCRLWVAGNREPSHLSRDVYKHGAISMLM